MYAVWRRRAAFGGTNYTCGYYTDKIERANAHARHCMGLVKLCDYALKNLSEVDRALLVEHYVR